MVANLGSIAGALGSLVSIGSQLFGGSNSAYKSYKYSKMLQENQYELNRKTRQTAFQDTRQSLEDANYNPLLAVGQQAQGGTYGASMSVTDPSTERLQNALNTASAISNIAQQKSQAKLNSAQTSLSQEQSKATIANVINQNAMTSAQTGLIKSQTEAQNISNNVENLYALDRAQSQIKQMNSSISLMQEQAKSEGAKRSLMQTEQAVNRAQIGVLGAQVGQIGAMTNNINQNSANAVIQGNMLRRQNTWEQAHPKLYGTKQTINSVSGAGSLSGFANFLK